MRTIKFIIQKEFLQIFRNRGMLPILFVMPLIQLIVLVNAATYEIKNIKVFIVDQDQTQVSQQLIGHFQASNYFTLDGHSSQIDDGKEAIHDGKVTMAVVIPRHFQRDLTKTKHAGIQLLINAVDGSAASVSQSYASAIIRDYANQLTKESGGVDISTGTIKIDDNNWYNPELKYTIYMVPGLLVVLVSMIGMFLTGMNIAREKEIGTIEQLNITPISRYQFIAGKLSPFWIIGMGELAAGIFIGWLLYSLPIVGHLWLIFGVAAIYLFVVLGLGLLISTVTETQQQAMFIAWFLMVVFILMGGLFTPLESMPLWAQKMTILNPIAQFIQVMRNVLLKGSGPLDISFQFVDLVIMAVVVNGLAIMRYRKTHA